MFHKLLEVILLHLIMSALTIGSTMFEDILVRIILPELVNGLSLRGTTVKVEDLMAMLKISRSSSMTPSSLSMSTIPNQQGGGFGGLTAINQAPLMMPLMGSVGGMALITQPATNKTGSKGGRKTGVEPQYKCFYQIRPNGQSGVERRCGKARAKEEYFCRSCGGKNKAAIDFNAGKLDHLIRQEMGEDFVSSRVKGQSTGSQNQNQQQSNNIFGNFGSQPNMSFQQQPLGSLPNIPQTYGSMSYIPNVTQTTSQNVMSLDATPLNGYSGVFVMNGNTKLIFRKIDETKLPVAFAKLTDTTTGKVIAPLSDQDKKTASDLKFDVVDSDPNGQVKLGSDGLSSFNPNYQQSFGMPSFPTTGQGMMPSFPTTGQGMMPSFPTIGQGMMPSLNSGLPSLAPLNGFGSSQLATLSSVMPQQIDTNVVRNIETTSTIVSNEIQDDGIPNQE